MTAIERLSIIRTDPFMNRPLHWSSREPARAARPPRADHVESGFSNLMAEIIKTTSRRQTLTDYPIG